MYSSIFVDSKKKLALKCVRQSHKSLNVQCYGFVCAVQEICLSNAPPPPFSPVRASLQVQQHAGLRHAPRHPSAAPLLGGLTLVLILPLEGGGLFF